MTADIEVFPTKNPDTVAFSLSEPLLAPGTGLSFANPFIAQNYPLAKALFEIPGVKSIWIIGNEIHVTKESNMRWPRLQSRIIEVIKQMTNSAGS